MSHISNGNINILQALGAAAAIELTDGESASLPLPLNGDRQLEAVSITAIGGPICFMPGDSNIVADQNSHYIGKDDTREFLIGTATHLAAVRYAASTELATELRVSVLRRGAAVVAALYG